MVGVWAGRPHGDLCRPRTTTAPRSKGTKGGGPAGKFDGYQPLVVEIVRFFKTGKPPVTAEETLEILAFMEAADESNQHGAPVSIESVMKNAERRLKELPPKGR